ncbi:MAG: GNAT family N-acetyltransferase [Allosphingosinicella sp.]|uniref:GNAT family N-acetyltransferase n=1 Tax=Allosphingosinicella sp. TaxID=2823234 RepID=UPI003945E11A
MPDELWIGAERLRLRPYRLGDFDDMHALMSQPAIHRYPSREPFSEEESWTRLLRHLGHWTEFGFGFLAVEERASGRFVGEAGFSFFRRGLAAEFGRDPEATWTIAPEYQGRGYAREAAMAAQDWADNKLGLSPTLCMVHADNAPSLSISRKLGYREIGRAVYLDQPVIFHERVRGSGGAEHL